MPNCKFNLKALLFLLIGMVFSFGTNAQLLSNSISLQGKVVDEQTGESLPYANISVLVDGALVTGTSTKLDGTFEIKDIQHQSFKLNIEFVGYASRQIIMNGPLKEKQGPLIIDLEKRTEEVVLSHPSHQIHLKDLLTYSAKQLLEPKAIQITSLATQSFPDSIAIHGIVIDQDTEEGLAFANISFLKDGELMDGIASNFDGAFQSPKIMNQAFSIKVEFLGYFPTEIFFSEPLKEENLALTVELKPGDPTKIVTIISISVPIIEPDNTISGWNFNSFDISKSPARY